MALQFFFKKLSAPVRRPRLIWSEQGVEVLGAVFEWYEYRLGERDFFNIHGSVCRLVRGAIRFPDTPGLLAIVGEMSSSAFTEERMLGTHVMLCQDVDEKTADTVAMRVSGNIRDGHVHRYDGYVLELHEWLEGHPCSPRARKWVLGSPSGIQS